MWNPLRRKPRPRPHNHHGHYQHPISDKHALRLVAGAVLLNPGCTLSDLEHDTGLPRPRIVGLLGQLRTLHAVTDDWAESLTRNLCRYRPIVPTPPKA